MKWSKADFYEFIINQEVIGFFDKPIKLKSGRLSYWYVNWRNVAEDVHSIDILSDHVISFVLNLGLKPDCFYGVPEGVTKLGIICQYKWAKSQSNFGDISYKLTMGRARSKEHGDPKDMYFLGVPQGNVIILEDVTTTGGSLIETIKRLKQINVSIIAAIGLTNRNELRNDKKSVKTVINELDVQYYAMSNAIDLLPKLKPEKELARNIEDYFKKYGVQDIKLL